MARTLPNVINAACDTGNVDTKVEQRDNLIGGSNGLAWLLIIGGIVGWAGAFALTLERFHVAANPDATLSCDIASFISCKSVMLSKQAMLFGFPNPLIGLAAFFAPVVVGFGILAKAKFAAWFWQLFALGNLLGFAFVVWLFSEAVFSIGALCPYCMVSWAGMIPMFWAVFFHGTREGFIPVPLKMTNFFVAAYDWAWVFTVATFMIFIVTIALKFWTLWEDLFRSL